MKRLWPRQPEWRIALVIGLVVGPWTLLMTEVPAALLAPALGPFVSVVYSHWDCSLARNPWFGIGMPILGVGLLLLVVASRRWRLRWPILLLWAAWFLAWCFLSLLSTVNAHF